LIYAIYHTLIDLYWPEGAASSDVAYGESFAATILMVPIYALWPETDTSTSVPVSLSAYWIVGVLIAVSALEVWLYYAVMRLGGAVYVSQAGYAAVLAGVIWGAVLFGEVVSVWIGASLALVLTALFLVSPRDRATDR
jgi:drug/metabolite transporter (DMT)-like permease